LENRVPIVPVKRAGDSVSSRHYIR